MGGIQIAAGQFVLYTAGGGVDPSRRCLAVSLDFCLGTDNEQLLADPFYLGIAMPGGGSGIRTSSLSRYIETALLFRVPLALTSPANAQSRHIQHGLLRVQR